MGSFTFYFFAYPQTILLFTSDFFTRKLVIRAYLVHLAYRRAAKVLSKAKPFENITINWKLVLTTHPTADTETAVCLCSRCNSSLHRPKLPLLAASGSTPPQRMLPERHTWLRK